MALETIGVKSVFVVLMTGICVGNTRKRIEAKRREIFETAWNVFFSNWRFLSEYVLTTLSMFSPRRLRSGSSATARRRWTWPSNSPRTRWWRATGLAKPYRPSLSLPPLPLLFLPLLFSLGPVPACYPGPSPDGGEDRHRSRRL